jgi:hypothetical protein
VANAQQRRAFLVVGESLADKEGESDQDCWLVVELVSNRYSLLKERQRER